MTFKNKPVGRISIDLSGPDGNAFVVMGKAKRWHRDLGIQTPWNEIQTEMMSGNYQNLILTLEKYFGKYIDIYGFEQ